MLLYNITFHLEESIEDKGIAFLLTEYISRAKEGGMLFNPRICLIHTEHAEKGKSYSIQFYVKNQQILEDWIRTTGRELSDLVADRFEGKMLGFATILEELDLDL